MSEDKEIPTELVEMLEKLGLSKENVIRLDSTDVDSLREKLMNHKCIPHNPTTYPSMSDKELTMFMEVLGVTADLPQEEFDGLPIVQWQDYIKHVCSHNKTYSEFVVGFKQALHVYNRTQACSVAFTTGVAIGLFLGRPDLVPSLEDIPKVNDEPVNTTE